MRIYLAYCMVDRRYRPRYTDAQEDVDGIRAGDIAD
jgi:hypothetical protein